MACSFIEEMRGHGIKLSMVHREWYVVRSSTPTDSMCLVSVTLSTVLCQSF